MSVEFNRLHSYYQKQSNALSKTASEKKQGSMNVADVRYNINIGIRDNYDWKVLKMFLVDFLSLEKEDIYHVDVMNNNAYFNTSVDKKNMS